MPDITPDAVQAGAEAVASTPVPNSLIAKAALVVLGLALGGGGGVSITKVFDPNIEEIEELTEKMDNLSSKVDDTSKKVDDAMFVICLLADRDEIEVAECKR